jgi:hypothetical protein
MERYQIARIYRQALNKRRTKHAGTLTVYLRRVWSDDANLERQEWTTAGPINIVTTSLLLYRGVGEQHPEDRDTAVALFSGNEVHRHT